MLQSSSVLPSFIIESRVHMSTGTRHISYNYHDNVEYTHGRSMDDGRAEESPLLGYYSVMLACSSRRAMLNSNSRHF